MKNLKKRLARTPLLRRSAMKALRLVARDITIRNPWSGKKIRLNAYTHKGYWYYRSDRERDTMRLFEQMISPGQTVIEVGGHIGFITQYFSSLVGQAGRVIVFEPGNNNLPYITRNLAECSNVHLERLAVSDECGTARFYEDNITGQNNSLLPDYAGADGVSRTHGQELVRTVNEVTVVTLDQYVSEKGITPDFVKIDIEGYEYQALAGMRTTLQSLKGLMVEVSERQPEVADLLLSAGFRMKDERGNPLDHLGSAFFGNVFAIRS